MVGFLVVSCSPQPTPQPVVTQNPESTITPTVASTQIPDDAALTIWISDDFSPNRQIEIIQLINSQAEVFTTSNPGNPVEVRLMHDLLNRLSLTSRAAPAALPDLILVDHQTLEISALKGLLHPVPMDSASLKDSQWIPGVWQSGKIQETQFGLPVVGDSLVLFRKDKNQIIPELDTLIASGDHVSVDLADPRSSLALSIYLSFGGSVEDESGRPILEEGALRSTLEWFQAGMESGSISREQNITPGKDLIWSRFVNSNLKWWIGWHSQIPPTDASPSNESSLPAIQDTKISSISNGWYWAFPNPGADHDELAKKLAHVYTQPEFLDEIARISGWLPVSPENDQESQILSATQLEPDGLILVTVAPLIQDSVLRVLSGESPELVAKQTVALTK